MDLPYHVSFCHYHLLHAYLGDTVANAHNPAMVPCLEHILFHQRSRKRCPCIEDVAEPYLFPYLHISYAFAKSDVVGRRVGRFLGVLISSIQLVDYKPANFTIFAAKDEYRKPVVTADDLLSSAYARYWFRHSDQDSIFRRQAYTDSVSSCPV